MSVSDCDSSGVLSSGASGGSSGTIFAYEFSEMVIAGGFFETFKAKKIFLKLIKRK